MLSRREQTVADMVTEGLSNREIALRMGVSEDWIKKLVSFVYDKTGNRLAIFFLAFVVNVSAHSVSLNWTQSKSLDVAYNTVACGLKSGGPYTLLTYVSKHPIVSFSKSPVPKGTYYCVVSAENAAGQTGGNSNEVKIVVPK